MVIVVVADAMSSIKKVSVGGGQLFIAAVPNDGLPVGLERSCA